MKTKKSTAFWAGVVSVVIFWISASLTNQLAAVGGAIVAALVALVGMYQGTNVADNYVKGKHYRPELDK
jgi:hypothetical protein